MPHRATISFPHLNTSCFSQFFKTESCDLPAMEKWLTAECPARIDVSGGWSDTPPITYEHGGAVTMVALLVNGKVKLYFGKHIIS